MKVTKTAKGYAAELLATADITLAGHKAIHANGSHPWDIIFESNGRLFRVQVKSTSTLTEGQDRRSDHYRFDVRKHSNTQKPGSHLQAYDDQDFDILACVVLETRQVAYLPITEVAQVIRLYPEPHRGGTRVFTEMTLPRALNAAREALRGS